ncbi:MAG: Hsp70 family protein, partial [Microbacteriaceae bacterium]|nr:Hsp70 family protein [Microbacteriaceae bacterium]
MSKKTVDFGIDLGTTNSAVARMTVRGCEVIPVQRLNYIPSVVARTKRGDLKVGTDALRADFVPIAKQFKRLMGTPEQIELADGSEMSPVELSAEILKALKAAVKLRTNEDLVNVVITVPAMFNQPQCEATIQAAELAGLNAVALLQEPIAAATAFLSENPIEGNYLVYDLGGGTIDVSVVRLRSGEMQVLGHGGDNYLGGSDIDKAIHKWLLDKLQTLGADRAQFSTPTRLYQATSACETTKIELSDLESSSIYLDGLPELPISKLELTREQLELLLESFVTKSIGITQDRLRDLELCASDVKAILLVGGPTQTPYIRDRLKAELGIPLNFAQDPMTVVAKGAA